MLSKTTWSELLMSAGVVIWCPGGGVRVGVFVGVGADAAAVLLAVAVRSTAIFVAIALR
jgi:hypothetical protein